VVLSDANPDGKKRGDVPPTQKSYVAVLQHGRIAEQKVYRKLRYISLAMIEHIQA